MIRALGASPLLVVAVATMLALATPSKAHAQTDASQSAAARELYAEGVRAAEQGRLDDAIAAFERSYALSPRDATLFNLAQVQERDGRLVAALESYRRFLARADADLLARHGQRARDAIATLIPRIARVEITVFGLAPGDTIRLDGAPLSRESLGLDLPVDPGTHEVAVLRDDRTCAASTITLRDGARRAIELRVACPARVVEVVPTSPPPADDPTPWIALGVGGGVLVVGAVVLGMVFTAPPSAGPEPFVGNVGAGSYVVP